MIVPNINKLIAEALKARDQIRLSTLRMLSSAFNYERINLQHDLTEDEELSVVRKEAKKRKDAIEAYKNAKRDDLAEKEQKELEILQEFLPAEMSDDDLGKVVDEAIKEIGATDISKMGQVMGAVMKKTSGQADGSRVSSMVKSKLG